MTHRPGFAVLLPFLVALFAGCADDARDPLDPGAPGRVASVAVAPTDLALEIGAGAALTATSLDRHGTVLHGYPITWTSTDTAVARVSPAGLVSARGAGTATIRASSEGRSGGVVVTVSERAPVGPAVAWILITPAGGTISQALGSARQLGVVARAADGTEVVGRAVVWSSSDPAVATVSPTGMLQAHAAGAARITAEVDGRRDSTIVSVPSLIARIEIDPATLALGVGDERVVVAVARDANGAALTRSIAWSSGNPAVATVDAAGRVVATGAGTTLITATSEGRSATTHLTVTGQQWRLTDAAGAPLPEILYATTVERDGVARTARFQVTGGTIRLTGERYALRLHGWLLVDGATPEPTTLASDGVMAYDMFTGAPLFFEGEQWTNQEPRFRSQIRADGSMELGWSRQPGGPIVPLGFAR